MDAASLRRRVTAAAREFPSRPLPPGRKVVWSLLVKQTGTGVARVSIPSSIRRPKPRPTRRKARGRTSTNGMA